MAKKKPKTPSNNIAFNKKARYDYSVDEKFEAGMVLQGWEVKSLREKKCQMVDSYVFIKGSEAWISNLLITPLLTASTHISPTATRVRKLLLHRNQIDKLMGAVDRKGYTIIPLSIYWSHGRVKIEIGLAKGKGEHDKRATEKDRDWKRDKQRLMKHR
ncbi:tmRNA-binding protein SmpB [hydrothermal vent metagenome]|uniref:TmRNA-binding protein SmpB n=1 Tax=hydrothermal vent metagenome TaxID=652676 RepID=A0A3B0Z1S1_9ZZZZ